MGLTVGDTVGLSEGSAVGGGVGFAVHFIFGSKWHAHSSVEQYGSTGHLFIHHADMSSALYCALQTFTMFLL